MIHSVNIFEYRLCTRPLPSCWGAHQKKEKKREDPYCYDTFLLVINNRSEGENDNDNEINGAIC